jgi:hypothetical protein
VPSLGAHRPRPWCEAAFALWYLVDLVLIATVTVADGGAQAPMALTFLLAIAFASASFPMASVIALGAITVATYLSIAVAEASVTSEPVLVLTAVLVCTSITSARQAHTTLASAPSSRWHRASTRSPDASTVAASRSSPARRRRVRATAARHGAGRR